MKHVNEFWVGILPELIQKMSKSIQARTSTRLKDYPKIVVVDGIIGAGKTSYLEVLEQDLPQHNLRVHVVREPVEKWKECGILQRFYNDPSRWAYHFQAKAFHDRIVENIKAWANHKEDTDIFILERSCFTDNLFMDMLFESKTIDELEYQHYNEWWHLWARIMPYMPHLFIYLKPDVDVCMKRLHKRNREGEENLSKDYQIALEAKHDKFFEKDSINLEQYVDFSHSSSSFTSSSACEKLPSTVAKVARLQTNKDFKDDIVARKEIVNQFLELIKDL